MTSCLSQKPGHLPWLLSISLPLPTSNPHNNPHVVSRNISHVHLALSISTATNPSCHPGPGWLGQCSCRHKPSQCSSLCSQKSTGDNWGEWGGWEGRSLTKEGAYVRLWLIHIVVQQKPMQHCKATIFQLKTNLKNFFKENANVSMSQCAWTLQRHLTLRGTSCF